MLEQTKDKTFTEHSPGQQMTNCSQYYKDISTALRPLVEVACAAANFCTSSEEAPPPACSGQRI